MADYRRDVANAILDWLLSMLADKSILREIGPTTGCGPPVLSGVCGELCAGSPGIGAVAEADTQES